MTWSLRFTSRTSYDAGLPSISIPVHLAAGAERITTSAKVDTGASHCVFRREIGEELGLRVASGDRLGIDTVTGRFVCYGHGVSITALEIALDTRVYFAENYGFPVNILGRRGWIDRLRLGLIDYDGLVLGSTYDDPGD